MFSLRIIKYQNFTQLSLRQDRRRLHGVNPRQALFRIYRTLDRGFKNTNFTRNHSNTEKKRHLPPSKFL